MSASTTRVIVGLSGGVDSAVAALIAKRRGFDVQGLFMANWDETDAHCTVAQDFQDARAVARDLGIPLHRVNFAAEYRERVFAHFLSEHHAGRTPNPDVLCNREIKFGVCLEYAHRLGASVVATGHYARLEGHGTGDPDRIELHQGRDTAKDQSYFLHAVGREALRRAWFPVGELLKSDVRGMAREAGLPVFDKPDSTGICFVGERPFRQFLARFVPQTPGPIETPEGERLGTHPGLAFFTLGQRGGLEIGGQRGHAESPWYVAAKDARRNRLVVVQGHDHPLLRSQALNASCWNWLVDVPRVATVISAEARVRHRQTAVPVDAHVLADERVEIRFHVPERAVTPGQSVVLYCGTRCLGGGIIDVTRPAGDRPLIAGERGPGTRSHPVSLAVGQSRRILL